MTRGTRAILVVAAALMAVGCALPWGRLWVLGEDGTTVAGGFGRGAEVVLPLAVVLVVAALAGWRWVAIGAAGAALAIVVYAGVVLPGALHDEHTARLSGIYAAMGDGTWRAATADGWTLAFYGALVACAGAIWLVVRWARESPPRVTMFADRA